jgi:hypothetical protein
MQSGAHIVGQRNRLSLAINVDRFSHRVDNHATVLTAIQVHLEFEESYRPEIAVEIAGHLADDILAIHAVALRLK